MSDVFGQLAVTFLVLSVVTFTTVGVVAVWNKWNRWMDKRAARKEGKIPW